MAAVRPQNANSRPQGKRSTLLVIQSHLPPGPYQLTNSTYPYDAYAASPVHRFFQMQQQLSCDASKANLLTGWGCTSDLYPWVEVTVGACSNGSAPPSPFND